MTHINTASFSEVSRVGDVSQRLALGTVQFGLNYGVANTAGQIDAAEAPNILRIARLSGMDTLDTAIAYGDSEAALGSQGVDSWKVVTKLPAIPSECQSDAQVHRWVQEQVRGSLMRLGLERVHGVLLHRPEQLLGEQGQALSRALQGLKDQGLAAKTGISIYHPQELDVLAHAFEPDLVQAPLNILDQSLIYSGWAERLKAKGVEIHVRSTFLQGLLLMKPSERPAKFHRWHSIWQQWELWLEKNGLTPLQACLRYSLAVAQVDKVLVGVDNSAQLNTILSAAQGPLPPLPEWIMSVDADLVNPAKWSQL